MNCPICSISKCSKSGVVYDDRYGYPGQFNLQRCPKCGHAFLECDFTPTQLGKLYNDYYPRRTLNVAQYKPHREVNAIVSWFNGLNSSAFRSVPKNVRVLDVGCGFGQSLGYHTARGCEVYGVEADENILRVADKFGFKVHVGLFDDSIYEPEFFDYVTLDQVIEHVADPLSVLRGVARILKPGGIAILSTPNAGGWGAKIFGRRWINWHAPYHMQFFSRCSMKLATQQAGIGVEKVKTITNSEWLHYQWNHLITYPIPGEPSRFWNPENHEWSLFQWRIMKVFSLMRSTKINHFLTRFFDSLGLGDNFVFVLKKL